MKRKRARRIAKRLPPIEELIRKICRKDGASGILARQK